MGCGIVSPPLLAASDSLDLASPAASDSAGCLTSGSPPPSLASDAVAAGGGVPGAQQEPSTVGTAGSSAGSPRTAGPTTIGHGATPTTTPLLPVEARPATGGVGESIAPWPPSLVTQVVHMEASLLPSTVAGPETTNSVPSSSLSPSPCPSIQVGA